MNLSYEVHKLILTGLNVSRQLCVLLNAEDIYKAVSKILLQEKNLKFVATMVDVLNTILLTSAELYDLRLQLRNFNKPVSSMLLQYRASLQMEHYWNYDSSLGYTQLITYAYIQFNPFAYSSDLDPTVKCSSDNQVYSFPAIY